MQIAHAVCLLAATTWIGYSFLSIAYDRDVFKNENARLRADLAKAEEANAGWVQDSKEKAETIARVNGENAELRTEQTRLRENTRKVAKEMLEREIAPRLTAIEKQFAEQAALHTSVNGFEKIDRQGYTLYYPPALQSLVSKELLHIQIEAAQLSVQLKFGKFIRKPNVRVVTAQSSESSEGFTTAGRFLREGDEILVWPSAITIKTLTHEFTHAWLFQRYEGKLPLAFDEALAYHAEDLSPHEMLRRLESGGGLMPLADLLNPPAKVDEKAQLQAQWNAWVVVYYLRCFAGRSPGEIADFVFAKRNLPEPKEVYGAVWAHAKLTESDHTYTVVPRPFANEWFDLVELGPISDLNGFDPKNAVSLRRLLATREFLRFAEEANADKKLVPFAPQSELPDVGKLWEARKRDVYRKAILSEDCCALKFQHGLSLTDLVGTMKGPLLSEKEFVETPCGPTLRARCETVAWTNSYRLRWCLGEPVFGWRGHGGPAPAIPDVEHLRKMVLQSALPHLFRVIANEPQTLWHLR